MHQKCLKRWKGARQAWETKRQTWPFALKNFRPNRRWGNQTIKDKNNVDCWSWIGWCYSDDGKIRGGQKIQNVMDIPWMGGSSHFHTMSNTWPFKTDKKCSKKWKLEQQFCGKGGGGSIVKISMKSRNYFWTLPYWWSFVQVELKRIESTGRLNRSLLVPLVVNGQWPLVMEM